MKYFVLMILASLGFVDGLLLFGNVSTWYFNPFVGLLFLVTLPFAGAMTVLFNATVA